jgi:hypothetical protein
MMDSIPSDPSAALRAGARNLERNRRDSSRKSAARNERLHILRKSSELLAIGSYAKLTGALIMKTQGKIYARENPDC